VGASLTGTTSNSSALEVDDAILDGEIIANDETGRPQFYDLLRGKRPPAYVAFDVVWLNGVDLRPVPLSERRELLRVILTEGTWHRIRGALSVGGRGWELFDLMCANDLEGIVAKCLADPYEPQARWFKIKNRDYTQKEGRGDLFNGPRQRPTHSAG
jgi:bifunctional non-homologous end joining protein LigD